MAMVQSDGAVGDGHVGVEGSEASLIRSRNPGGNVGIHGGSEGNLDAL